MTAVLAKPGGGWRDPQFQQFAHEVIGENAPAHILVDYCFLDSHLMDHFEYLYWRWTRALRRRSWRHHWCRRMRLFLERCQTQYTIETS